MSRASTNVRYDGPILADHKMDVADLAPALFALSELCKIANKKSNGDRAAVKVLIDTSTEHNCFEFKLEIVQTLSDFTKSIFSGHGPISAQDILAWLGIGTGSTLTSAWGLLKFLKWLKGRKVTSTQMVVKDGSQVVQVTVNGNHNNLAFLHPQALELARDAAVLGHIRKVVQPLTKEGYDSLEFENETQGRTKISKEEAVAIEAIQDPSDLEPLVADAPQVIHAWIKVYAPVYDESSTRWRFCFGKEHHYMDISETQIAAKAIERGGALINDAYYVRLEITQVHKSNGEITNHYKIKEVLDFKPAEILAQDDLFSKKDNPS